MEKLEKIYILAIKSQIDKKMFEAREWCYEADVCVAKEYIIQALTERELNKMGFTMNPARAKYPK